MITRLIFILLLTATGSASLAQTSKGQPSNQHIEFGDGDTLFIAPIQYLPETDEFAVELIWNANANWGYWFDTLLPQLDSVVFGEDGDYMRYYLTEELANEYALLGHESLMKVYEKDNRFVGGGTFSHYEFINQNIHPIFAVVYQVSGSKGQGLYAITEISDKLPEISHPVKKEVVLAKLDLLDFQNTLDSESVLYNSCGTVGFVAAHDQNEHWEDPLHSKLLAFQEGGETTVIQLEDNWVFMEIHPLPVYSHGFPMLWIRQGKWESDWIVDMLYRYDGSRYVSSEEGIMEE